MPLKTIDYLSPKISLFYYGRRRHSAVFGGVLTIIMIICCLTYITYLFSDVLNHSSSTFQYYKHFFEDPGNFFFNNTNGIFHFFHFYNPKNNSHLGKYSSKYVHIFLTNSPDEYKQNSSILSEQEHWVYDNCRDGIDNKYYDQNIFVNASFQDGICIRYYYNKEKKEYYPIEDSQNFIYPLLGNMELNMNYSISTIIGKCDNNSILTNILGICASDNEIKNYLKDYIGLNFNVLEHEINPKNYSNQIYYFNYIISNILQKNKIIENNIIFAPLRTDIKGGIIYPKRKKNLTYSFNDYYRRDETHQNKKNEENQILSIYNYCLSPSGFVFKSDYETLYDIFPKMGGIIQLIYYIFFGINFLYNRFTIINDTKKLFFQLHNNKRANRNIQIANFAKAVDSLRRINSKNEEKTNNNMNDSKIIHYSSNILSKFYINSNNKKDLDIENSKNLAIFPNSSQKKKRLKFIGNYSALNNRKKINNQIKKELCLSFIESKNKSKDKEESVMELINNIKNDTQHKDKFSENISKNIGKQNDILVSSLDSNNCDKDIALFKNILEKFFNHKKRTFIYENITAEEIKKYFSFMKFIYSHFCFQKAKMYHYILDKFRKKLLSEEHFFRTHNYLYLFEKCFDIQESKKIDIIELYKNL